MASEECLDVKNRAADILLGALGYDVDARITKVEATADGYRGQGIWSDGEVFNFESEDELTELERWALTVLLDGS